MKITKHFVTVGARRVHYLRAGTGPAVALLHSSPCSAKATEAPLKLLLAIPNLKLVPLEGADVTPTRLRSDLSKALPSYMLPARWMQFERLPKNANGKIDRKALREQFQQEAQSA